MKVQILDHNSNFTIILQAISRSAGWEVHTSGIDPYSSLSTFSEVSPDLLLIDEDTLSSDRVSEILKPLICLKRVQVIICTDNIVSQNAYNLSQGSVRIIDKLFVFTIPWHFKDAVYFLNKS